MTTENGFSWSRTAVLMKRYIAENRRNLAMAAGVSFGILLLLAIMSSKLFNSYDEHWERSLFLWMMYLWIGALGLQILGSLTFCSLNSKAKRIGALMIPAAQSEKFVSQVMIYVVGGNLFLILSMVIADGVSAGVFGYAPGFSQLPLDELFEDAEMTEITIVAGLAALWTGLFAQAIYVAGSALWPKLSFLKTFVALMVVQTLLPILIPNYFMTDFMEWVYNTIRRMEIDKTMIRVIAWSCIALLYVALGGMYVVAWKLFKRTQVIQRFKMR